MRFGTATFAEDFLSYAKWVRAAEDFGFDFLGYGDSQNLWGDLYVALTIAAQNSSRALIGPTVTNPMSRHPAVAAGAIASIQQVSKGRAFFGLGSGDSALCNIGVRPATLQELEDYAIAIKALCAKDEAIYKGQRLNMEWATESVPLYLSAEGPRMLELAGRIADGVIIGNGLTEDVVRDSIARVRAGADSVGRDFDTIDLWWLAKPYFAESEEAGWRALNWSLAGSANHAFRFTMEDKFVPEMLRERIRELQNGYAAHQHAKVGQGDHNASLVEEAGLTEFLGRRFTICGPPERMTEKIRELQGYGVRNLFLTQLVEDRISFMGRLSREIFPAFK